MRSNAMSTSPLTVNPKTMFGKSNHSRPAPQRAFKILPRELEDIIFDMAYPSEGDDLSRYITKTYWDEREMATARQASSTYSMRAFPSPKVDEFMVSRGFYQSAADAWVRNQHFRDEYLVTYNDAFSYLRRYLQFEFFCSGLHKSIIFDFCTKLSISLYTRHGCVHELPRLKDLSILVSHDIFKETEPRFSWKCALTQDEVEKVMRSFNLDKLSGLVKFSITPLGVRYAKTLAHKKQFEENIELLEALVKPIAMRTRDPTTARPWSEGSAQWFKLSPQTVSSKPGNIFAPSAPLPTQARSFPPFTNREHLRPVQRTLGLTTISSKRKHEADPFTVPPSFDSLPRHSFAEPLPLTPAVHSKSPHARRSKNSIVKPASGKQNDTLDLIGLNPFQPDINPEPRFGSSKHENGVNNGSGKGTELATAGPSLVFGCKSHHKPYEFTIESSLPQTKVEMYRSLTFPFGASGHLITSDSSPMISQAAPLSPRNPKPKPVLSPSKVGSKLSEITSPELKRASSFPDPTTVTEQGLKKIIKQYSKRFAGDLFRMPNEPDARKILEEDTRIFTSFVCDVKDSLTALAAGKRPPGGFWSSPQL